jgi:N-acetylneuraminic acid mutarotase
MANGPPDLVGHVSIILPDGRILVFGGYVPTQSVLLLFSTIYVLDTTKTPYTWSRLLVSSGSLPNARRAFAATLIAPDRILIHGGSDAQLQTTLDDGWVLDLSPPEATWTRLDSLAGIGARRDHFAVSSGDNVVFGFG